ncbi:MAG: hypothetical protein AAFY60_08300 [Myxococcota bacterium]
MGELELKARISTAYQEGKSEHLDARNGNGGKAAADRALSHYQSSIDASRDLYGGELRDDALRAAYRAGLLEHARANVGLQQVMGLTPPSGSRPDPASIRSGLERAAAHFQSARLAADGSRHPDVGAHLQYASMQVDLGRLANRTGDYGARVALQDGEIHVTSPVLEAFQLGAQAALDAQSVQQDLVGRPQVRGAPEPMDPAQFQAALSTTTQSLAFERQQAIMNLNQGLLASFESLQGSGVLPPQMDSAQWMGLVSAWTAARLVE